MMPLHYMRCCCIEVWGGDPGPGEGGERGGEGGGRGGRGRARGEQEERGGGAGAAM